MITVTLDNKSEIKYDDFDKIINHDKIIQIINNLKKARVKVVGATEEMEELKKEIEDLKKKLQDSEKLNAETASKLTAKEEELKKCQEYIEKYQKANSGYVEELLQELE
jgi:Skp family chaperone for outer membrane proteins